MPTSGNTFLLKDLKIEKEEGRSKCKYVGLTDFFSSDKSVWKLFKYFVCIMHWT